MNRSTQLPLLVALCALALGVAILCRPGRAQPVVTGQVLKFAEYYDAPHETQMKSLLEGARAQRQPDGRILVTQAKCQTFRETGEGELVVEAPECLYDPGQRSISSPGSLHVQTADGKFAINGEGFLWQQTNSTLQVSNRVHTIIHPELVRAKSATTLTNKSAEATPPIDIFSDQFEFEQLSGKGVYQGNVRVAGTNLNSTAGRLTILLPLAEHRLQSLTAEEHVVVDYEKMQATGGWAFYSADTGLIQLTNQPTWRIEQRDGSGDELVFDQTNRVFYANGHAKLKMPTSGMGTAGFLSRPGAVPTNSLPPTNQFVEVQCDNYEIRTNLAVFRKQVHVSDRLGDQLQGEMDCARMTLTFIGTNELEKIVAERDVVISQTDKRFTAARAEFNGTNALLDLTGNPAWQAGSREGKGDWMRVNLAREEMLVEGNARMKLPAGEVGRSTFTGAGTPKTSQAKEAARGFADIYSREYLLTPDAALFQGGVRIEHPSMKWTCDELTLLSLPELGKSGHMMIAEPAVVFDVQDEQGRNFHGTGRKAVYTHRISATLTNDLMELTGTPAVLEATNIVGRNNVITLDLSNHRMVALGKYAVRGTLPASGTNLFRARKSGRPK